MHVHTNHVHMCNVFHSLTTVYITGDVSLNIVKNKYMSICKTDHIGYVC